MNEFLFTHEALLRDLGLTMLMGLALYMSFQIGLFSLAQMGFATLGAYGTVVLHVRHDWPTTLAVAATLLATGVIGYLLARSVQHLRGVYMALATIAFSEVVNLLALQWTSVTGGAVGMTVPRIVFNRHIMWTCVVVFAASALIARRPVGRQAVAIRHARQQARMGGIRVLHHERRWMVASALLSAFVGFLAAYSSYFITPDTFGFNQLVEYLSAAIVGGVTVWLGPVVGALLLVVPPDLIDMDALTAQIAFGGLALLMFALVAPQGVVLGLRDVIVNVRSRASRRTDERSQPVALVSVEAPAELTESVADPVVPLRAPQPATGGANVLQFTGVSRSYGGVQALKDVSGSVKAGEVCGLIGPNGAGKTTLLNMLSGIDRPDAGRIEVNGRELTGGSVERFVRAGVGRTFQLAQSYGELSVRENVELALGIRKQLRRSRPEWLTESDDEVDQILDLVGLGNTTTTMAASGLPYGAVRRLELARTLALTPDVVLLDEPLAGAPEEADAIASCISRLTDAGAGVLLVDHDVSFVFGLADHVIVLDLGAVIASGIPEAVRSDAKVQAAYLGMAVVDAAG